MGAGRTGHQEPGHWAPACPGTPCLGREHLLVPHGWQRRSGWLVGRWSPSHLLPSTLLPGARAERAETSWQPHRAHIRPHHAEPTGRRFPGGGALPQGSRSWLGAGKAPHPSHGHTGSNSNGSFCTFLSALSTGLTHPDSLHLHKALRDRCCSYSRFPDEEIEGQRGCITRPKAHST